MNLTLCLTVPQAATTIDSLIFVALCFDLFMYNYAY